MSSPGAAPLARANQLNLTFDDLTYVVRNRIFHEGRFSFRFQERKKLLTNVSGEFRAGELTAIIGPSGAGKSKLMDILAGFRKSNVTGEVRVNGRVRTLAAFRRSSAYIMQDGNLQPLLTVEESMRIAADLKLDSSAAAKHHSIDVIIKELGLEAVRASRTKNLSGGEKKRLAIALELIGNPPIMFFDEPTSGLDSVASRQCIGILKSLAREGRTIVCILHQPSGVLFDVIDHLYVVADSCCVYSGGSRNLVPYLRSLGLHCPTYHNPADYLLEIINGEHGEHVPRMIEAAQNGRSQRWRGTREDAPNLDRKLASLGIDRLPKLPLPINAVLHEIGASSSAYYARGSFKQLCILLRRNALKLSRDRVLVYSRLAVHFLLSFLVGCLFYKIGQDAAYAIDNFNLIFFNTMTLMYNAFNTTIITFPEELPILAREHFNRWYKLPAYYVANKLIDLPVQIVAVSTYTLIFYQMSGQIPELRRLGLCLLIYLLASLVAQMVGLILGTIFNVQNGVIFGPFAILPFVVFSGFFVHIRDAHPYLQWLFHASFFKYAFEGAMVAIYGYDRPKMKCSKDYCHYTSPKTLLDAVDMKNSNYLVSVLFLVGLYVVLDVMAYSVIRLKMKLR
ncbi:ATP-binding cassette sub-family G member 4-like [Copidosoma floridanum]|uniref:ATP-binding cassette sub-family G member 4-like n=1 Tax=Copidosoma floridanum TaxID=29053 RepID=UPI0006C98349|nr:ATP-binding cassette sub-family G member 4-like [Copidosoma floridanum]XP_023248546.1 ATP-binding cassette sub-family G member 4-like [Copidosoma floridanum]